MGLFKNSAKWIMTATLLVLTGCAPANAPGDHSADIPAPAKAREKMRGINENYQPITYVHLDKDILVPQPMKSDPLPDVYVGPYELRSETLAGALQLILADFDIAMAFETEAGLTRRITVANLSGRLPTVVRRICGLADLYCAYNDGLLTIKDTETFVVDLPPIGDEGAYGQIVTGLTNVLTTPDFDEDEDDSNSSSSSSETLAPIVDTTTQVMVYQASSRTARYAEEYFARLRKNTAMIVFETNIWEVTLDNENRTGIDWTGALTGLGNFDIDIGLPGAAPAGLAAPITITPTYTGSSNLTSNAVFEFISSYGAVKTISQPQLTVLSGSEATLSVQNSEAYVSQVTRTVDENGDETYSLQTDTIDTGLNLTIGSGWDESTVYGTIDITLDELLSLDEFVGGDGTTVQLPSTTARSLQTQVRVRPGDAILIAGLVTENDNKTTSGPGFMKPLFATSRLASAETSELVFLLRPRVLVFETPEMRARKKAEALRAGEIEEPQTGLSLGSIPAAALAPAAPGSNAPPAPSSPAADPILTPVPVRPLQEGETAIVPMTEPATANGERP